MKFDLFAPLAVALLASLCAGMPSAPDGTAVGPPTTVGSEEAFIQTAAQRVLGSYEPHKEYNFTCDQCYRMSYSLKKMCHETGGSSVKEEEQKRFLDLCEAETDRVSYGDGPSRRWYKCDAYYKFVKELYCPYDPCVQVSIQSNKAHKAVCGLLRCEGTEHPLTLNAEDGPMQGYEKPATCAEYVQAAVSHCEADPETPPEHLCANYTQSFTKEGCEIVVDRMRETVAPMRMCDAWSCDKPQMSESNICGKLLKMPGDEEVAVPSYLYFKSQIMNTTDQHVQPEPVPLEAMGINVTRATLGYGEHCLQDHTNNILLRSRAQCQGLRKCMYDNPNVVNNKVLADAEPGCEGNFAIEYFCHPNGKKHTVYGPHTATYRQLPLDCTSEVLAFIKTQNINHLQPDKSLPGFNPPPFVKGDMHEGTRRRENSFMTPSLQKQTDDSMKAQDMSVPTKH